MRLRRSGGMLSAVALLAACGGGGGGGSSPTPTPGPITSVPTPTAPAPSATCSLRSRQDFALAQLREWYLFPDTLPANLDPSPFTTVQDYIDALTATARSQRKDRFFTYITSIREENAFFSSGSSAGFGIRLSTDVPGRRVFVSEAFEGAPALAERIDRGTEILAIGNDAATLQTIEQIITARGDSGVTDALGASTPGLSRTLRVRDTAGMERTVTLAKAEYSITPVSSRYGVSIIEDGGRRVGYLNLRTYIDTADPALRNAFASFRAQGITEVVIDLRYNGGGLVRIAELMGDVLGGNRTTNDVFSITAFRPEKSSENETDFFQDEDERNYQSPARLGQAISATKIAFIGTRGTASASELVINSFSPYLRANMALIGSNTFGKPVGQIALDRAACDDRLRVVAFATQNAAGQGDYYDGLASKVDVNCQAGDDLTRQLGDPREGSIRQALDFLAGRSCTRISAVGARTASASRDPVRDAERELLTPERPTAAQREVPGLF